MKSTRENFHPAGSTRASGDPWQYRLEIRRRTNPRSNRHPNSPSDTGKTRLRILARSAIAACFFRASWRRVWGQAGDADRGSLRFGGPEDRPADEVGMDARRGVHRRSGAASLSDAGQTRSAARRNAHGHRASRGFQYRRVSKSRRRGSVCGTLVTRSDLWLSEQERDGLRGSHQRDSGGRIPRIRENPDDVCHRVCDR